MKFSDLVIPTKEVTVSPEQKFSVRGMAYVDLVIALTDYSPALKVAFEEFENHRMSGEKFTQKFVKDTLTKIIKESPDAVAAVICLAADDYSPESVAQARKLPIGTQLIFLGAIIELSMAGEADIKKVEEIVLGVIQTVTKTIREWTATDWLGGPSLSGDE